MPRASTVSADAKSDLVSRERRRGQITLRALTGPTMPSIGKNSVRTGSSRVTPSVIGPNTPSTEKRQGSLIGFAA